MIAYHQIGRFVRRGEIATGCKAYSSVFGEKHTVDADLLDRVCLAFEYGWRDGAVDDHIVLPRKGYQAVDPSTFPRAGTSGQYVEHEKSDSLSLPRVTDHARWYVIELSRLDCFLPALYG